MRETIEDYPALRMEDDGFLLSLKMDFVDSREKLFGSFEGLVFAETVNELIRANRKWTDKGSSLPIYIPVYSDGGDIVGSKAVPVWSGSHIGFPLYPGLSKDSVESFLYGGPRGGFGLSDDFLACDPAFRLALLVHYTVENVIIHELAIESFLLGFYEEMPFVDGHYLQTGLPSTLLVSVEPSIGLSNRRSKISDDELCVARGEPRTNGWVVRVRGSRPKEAILRDCWQEIRSKNTRTGIQQLVVGGKEYTAVEAGEDGRVRERSGSPEVDYMVAWVDSLRDTAGLPMRGIRVNWTEIHRLFEHGNSEYVDCWTADTMRRTYLRRKKRCQEV